jgi:hypothetical protein
MVKPESPCRRWWNRRRVKGTYRDGRQGEGRSLRADSRNEVNSALSNTELGAGQVEGVTMVVSATAAAGTGLCG